MTYSPAEIELLTTLKEQGCSWVTIGKALKKKPDAVRKWWTRYVLIKDLPPKVNCKKKCTDGRASLLIKKILQEDPVSTLNQIQLRLEEKLSGSQVVPSRSSIHNFLKTNGIVVLKMLKKPLLRDYNREKRVKFAKEGLQFIEKLQYETIWSDETTVRQFPSTRELYFRCHTSTRKEDMPINPRAVGGGFSVMFWGCFSGCALGPLIALEGSQNQYTYRQLLQDYLLPEIEAAKTNYNVDMDFMQDNAPCHKTKLINDFLSQHKIHAVEWPSQSPDLNPIENLWSIIKRRRQRKFGFPKSKQELIEQVFRIWEEIDQDLVETLSESIEHRLEQCIKLKGKYTKY